MAGQGEGFDLMNPFFRTELGTLYQGDCVNVLTGLQIEGVKADLIFCDPPFNLGKKYGKHVDDDQVRDEYLCWTQRWLDVCVNVLAPGGSIMVYNMPEWCIESAYWLRNEWLLQIVDWIAIHVTQSYPRSRGLYRSHYGVIHLSDGVPKTLNKIRVPIETCRHCKKELRDYGGHRDKMNKGVSISDVWMDIPTVRHKKYKTPGWKGPQLSTKFVRRCVLLATNPGDLVIDPMIGSGTTAAVCEVEGRRWIGVENGDCSIIQARIEQKNTAFHKSLDLVD